MSSYLYYYGLIFILGLISISLNNRFYHWALLAILSCSIPLARRVILWTKSDDPFLFEGVCGLFMLYYFVVSPLLFIVFDGKLPYVVDNPSDYRKYTGILAIINFVGLNLFNLTVKIISRDKAGFFKIWKLRPNGKYILGLFILISGTTTGFMFFQHGGFTGLFRAYGQSITSKSEISGLASIITFPFAVYVFIYVLLFYKHWFRLKLFKIFFISILLVIQVLISGYSGVRGNFVFAIFWSIIIYHYLVAPIQKWIIVSSIIPFVLSLWIFSFYKSMGLEAFARLNRGDSVIVIAEDSNRSMEGMLWGDMSRVSIHSYMVYKFINSDDYDYPLGRTYLESWYPVVPFWLWPNKPINSGKVVAGTQLIWGRNYYEGVSSRFSSHAYGITGEAALNFGLPGFIIGFIFYGLIYGIFKNIINSLGYIKNDYKYLVYPFFLWWGFNLLLWDSDNYIAHNIGKGFLLLASIYLLFNRRHDTTSC